MNDETGVEVESSVEVVFNVEQGAGQAASS
jgi:hypothetical protein